MQLRDPALRLLLAGLMSGSLTTAVAAQNPSTPALPSVETTTVPDPAASEPLPIDIQRVKQQAEVQPAVKLDARHLRFYVLVEKKSPTFKDLLGSYDLINGATKGGAAMTHQEFVNSVTPKALKELLSQGSSFGMLQAAVMNAIGQALAKKIIGGIRSGNDDQQAIRDRIDKELSALEGREP